MGKVVWLAKTTVHRAAVSRLLAGRISYHVRCLSFKPNWDKVQLTSADVLLNAAKKTCYPSEIRSCALTLCAFYQQEKEKCVCACVHMRFLLPQGVPLVLVLLAYELDCRF